VRKEQGVGLKTGRRQKEAGNRENSRTEFWNC
jgi:hypothetical protein